jgi:hypothetical protein
MYTVYRACYENGVFDRIRLGKRLVRATRVSCTYVLLVMVSRTYGHYVYFYFSNATRAAVKPFRTRFARTPGHHSPDPSRNRNN